MFIPVFITESDGIQRVAEPLTMGLPFPVGLVCQLSQLSLLDPDGHLLPLQSEPLLRWADGSIKWALLDFQVDVPACDTRQYQVVIGKQYKPPGDFRGIRVAEHAHGWVVDTGMGEFALNNVRLFPFREIILAGTGVMDGEHSGWRLQDADGREYDAVANHTTVETVGPLRTTFLVEGAFVDGQGGGYCDCFARLSFFANSSTVRVAVTLGNSRRARHPQNLWDLGDPGSIYIKDFSLQISMKDLGPPRAMLSSELGQPFTENPACDVTIYQDSSGGPHWDSLNHVNRDNQVKHSFCGYQMEISDHVTYGKRALPLVVLESGTRGVAGTIRHFWQNFPKAIEVMDRSLVLRLFPHQYNDVHELQGGEQKTHVLYLSFLDNSKDVDRSAWVRAPLVPRSSPEWYAETKAVSYLTTRNLDPNDEYLSLVDAAIEGDDTFAQKRERIDEYGWRHFGDMYADHEGAFYQGSPPVVSHYNNQYDAINGAFIQYLRSGDLRWHALMDELAAHVVDIDIYHTNEDRAAYNHGVFWHTNHYTHASTSTHRTFSRHAGRSGGGPSNEHCYATGLLHHYLLTGNPQSRQAVVEVAQWVIDADDGTKTLLRWLDQNCTGHASSTESPTYHGPGRGAGNAINALMDASVLTSDARFIEKAEQLIRRCIHPLDDVGEMQLLDVERRWSYTVFLCALGRYLDYKIEHEQVDRMYAYAQAGLLRYARWMAEHEIPYLTKPENLEFPTETWAAQEMRKSDVFKLAAKHAQGEERVRFLERSEFFFRSSVQGLLSAKTRTLTRPVVLMMSHGYMHAYFQHHPQETAPVVGEPHDFGRPERFRPQRERAMKKLVVLALLGVSAVLIWAAYYFLP